MSKMAQGAAVYAAVIAVCNEKGVHFEDGMDVTTVVTDSMRESVSAILCEGFRNGTIELKDTASNREKLQNATKLNQYVSGLISNWFRKDLRMNGGEKYEPKNPGSRTGSTDATLKALRQLAVQFKSDAVKSAELQKHIDARMTAISAEKAKKIQVDLSKIDPTLLAQLGIKTA